MNCFKVGGWNGAGSCRSDSIGRTKISRQAAFGGPRKLEEQAAGLNGLVKTFRLPTSGDFSTETRQRVTLIA